MNKTKKKIIKYLIFAILIFLNIAIWLSVIFHKSENPEKPENDKAIKIFIVQVSSAR